MRDSGVFVFAGNSFVNFLTNIMLAGDKRTDYEYSL
jgi:hypothetical protein